jgi:hypothetical protein
MRLLVSVMLVIATGAVAFGQVAGDYQTAGTGKWSSAATWSTYNGSAWVPASSAPTGSSGAITVQAADSVDIDVAITIAGTLRSMGGRFGYSTGSLIIGNGGVYEHAANGGGMPTAAWSTGSTCLVTGATSTAPSNASQNFYNFTWNCPAQTGGLNVGWNSSVIGGTLRVVNSNSQAFRMTAGGVAAPVPNTITIMGDVITDSSVAYVTSSGSSSPADTIEVILNGNIISKGTFQLANGSGVKCNWLVKGDVTILGGAFSTNSSTTYPDSLIFAGTAKQTFSKAGSLTSLANVRFAVRGGSILDLDTNNVGTSTGSTFTLEPGATLISAHPGGLGGNLRNGGPTTLSTSANYVFDGAVAQADTLMPATVKNLTINNAGGLSLRQTTTVDGVLALTTGTLSAGSGKIIIGPSGSVNRTDGYVAGGLQKALSSGSKTFEVGTTNGYSPVGINVTTGAGNLTVLAIEGSHPNTFDAAKTLQRYWTLTADPGITRADLTFNYLAADVKGDESKYRAWKYSGTGTAWNVATGSVNVGNHAVTATGVTSFSDWTCGESAASAVEPSSTAEIPATFFVSQNYPNPFNPATTVTYGLPKNAYVSVKVYTLLGQEVATLFSGEQTAGVHTLRFDATKLGSGVYLYRVQAGSSVGMKRMVVVK